MPATTPDNLRYPLRADKPAGADQIEALATDTQAALVAAAARLTATGLAGARVRWGSVVQPVAVPSGGVTVQLGVTFTAPPLVVAVLGDEHSQIGYVQMVTAAVTTSSFSVRVLAKDGSVWAAGGNVRINYVAVGALA